MGQCYSVVAQLKFKNNDSTSFCEIIKNEIDKMQNDSAVFDLSHWNLSDPIDCFKILTSANACNYQGCFISEFGASYGWERILLDIFIQAMSVLDNGSIVYIEPDNWKHEITVENGKVSVITNEY